MGRGKAKVKMNDKVKNFILEKISEGYDAKQITKKWPDKVPSYEHIIRTSLNDPEFRDNYNDAYTILLLRRLDELNELTDENWCKDRLAQFDGDYKLAFEARRTKLDTLKFVLGKMAPVLSKRFDKVQNINVSGVDTGPKYAVINYYANDKPVLDKQTVNVIEGDKSTDE
jgi:hypothetical protein